MSESTSSFASTEKREARIKINVGMSKLFGIPVETITDELSDRLFDIAVDLEAMFNGNRERIMTWLNQIIEPLGQSPISLIHAKKIEEVQLYLDQINH